MVLFLLGVGLALVVLVLRRRRGQIRTRAVEDDVLARQSAEAHARPVLRRDPRSGRLD